MKVYQYLFLLFFISACDAGDFLSIPTEQGLGEYDYDSSSSYYDDRGDLSQQGTNSGSFDMTSLGDESSLMIYPRLGWSYQISIDNLIDHNLTDGSVVTSFRVQRSSQYFNHSLSNDDNEFRLDGTTNVTLEDNGTLIGTYDGLLYDNGEIVLEYESVNIESGKYVITTINGYEIN